MTEIETTLANILKMISDLNDTVAYLNRGFDITIRALDDMQDRIEALEAKLNQ